MTTVQEPRRRSPPPHRSDDGAVR